MAGEELLRMLVASLGALEIPYALTGSIASVAYGEPRATLDIDVVADLRPEDVTRLKAHFPAPDFYLDEEAARIAIERREQFNVIHPDSGFKVDFFIPHDDIERSQVRRRRTLAVLAGLTATFTPPEELIVKKLEYYQMGGSDKHLRDIASMLRISGAEIDLDKVASLAQSAGLLQIWRSFRTELRG